MYCQGEATLKLFPHIQGIKKFGVGLMENLFTLVSVSHAKSFPMVDFIDTPGLVDGDLGYAFPVNE